MKTSTQKRIARFSGLLLVALLLVALAVPAALAMRTLKVPGSGTTTSSSRPRWHRSSSTKAPRRPRPRGARRSTSHSGRPRLRLQCGWAWRRERAIRRLGERAAQSPPRNRPRPGVSATTIWISVGRHGRSLIIALVAWALIPVVASPARLGHRTTARFTPETPCAERAERRQVITSLVQRLTGPGLRLRGRAAIWWWNWVARQRIDSHLPGPGPRTEKPPLCTRSVDGLIDSKKSVDRASGGSRAMAPRRCFDGNGDVQIRCSRNSRASTGRPRGSGDTSEALDRLLVAAGCAR